MAEQETAPAQEDLLIQLLWGKNHAPPHADVVPWWAAEELANRGASRALTEITEAITYRNPTSKGTEFIRMCSTKIELLNTSPNREEALTRALAMEDFTQGQQLKSWAIQELGKLGSENSRSILIGYALSLQNRYYDENGKRIEHDGQDGLEVYAPALYNMIVDLLREGNMNDSQIKAAGVEFDRYFILLP